MWREGRASGGGRVGQVVEGGRVEQYNITARAIQYHCHTGSQLRQTKPPKQVSIITSNKTNNTLQHWS